MKSLVSRLVLIIVVLTLILGSMPGRARASVQFSLTVNKSGSGSVVEPPGAGPFTFSQGTVVNLLAVPEAGYHFVSWGGDTATIADPASADTAITMNGSYTITASFAPDEDAPGEGWAKDAGNPVLVDGAAAGSPYVIYDSGSSTYKMWYTRLVFDLEKIEGFAADIRDVGLGNLVADLLALDFAVVAQNDAANIKAVIEYLAGLSDAELLDLINSSYSVISYATSPDGRAWQQQGDILQGTPGAWDARLVGFPSVVKNAGGNVTYEMWYTAADIDAARVRPLIADLSLLSVDDLSLIISDIAAEDAAKLIADTREAMGDAYLLDVLLHLVSAVDGVNMAIGRAVSGDGVNWVKDAANPVFEKGTGAAWDRHAVSTPSVIKNGAASYEMFYTGFSLDFDQLIGVLAAQSAADIDAIVQAGVVTGIGRAVSTDGSSWVRDAAPVLLKGSSGEWDSHGVFAPVVKKDLSGGYQMWYTGGRALTNGVIGFLKNTLTFNNALLQSLDMAIGHATSVNGSNWVKDAANPVLAGGEGDAWDRYGVGSPAVVNLDGTVQMWYTGITANPGSGILAILDGAGAATAFAGSRIAIGRAVMGVAADNVPPAAIADLAAGSPTPNSITLTWTAPGDDDMTGQAAYYKIRYAGAVIDTIEKWNAATEVADPPPPLAAGSPETFSVSGLEADTTYYFAVRTGDETPSWSDLSNSPSATTGVQMYPRFTIAHGGGKYSFMFSSGDNITETVNITSLDNFSGTVSLTLQGPSEITALSSLNPTQVSLAPGETKPVTLTLGAGSMTPSGTYQANITGQTSAYGGLQTGYFFSVNIGAAGQPLLSASPAVVAAGGQTNFFASQFTPGEAVSLQWHTGPLAPQTIATGQVDFDGTWSAPVTIPESMIGGSFGVKAVTPSQVAVFQLTITTGGGPDFVMSASPSFISVAPGTSADVTIFVTSVSGFNSPVTLSASWPPGVSASLSAGSVTPSGGQAGSAVLSISVAEWVNPTMYHVIVEGDSADPPLAKVVDISVDVPPASQWGPSVSLSQSYGRAGDIINITGANFPPHTGGLPVTVTEAFSGGPIQTSPATVYIVIGSFAGTVTVPSGVPSGNYRLRFSAADVMVERDFQILGEGSNFSLGLSPDAATVATEAGGNTASVSVNLFSIGGSGATVNLAIEGAPNWLEYRFGALPVNTPATGAGAVTVPPSGSAFRNLSLTASLTAPTGTYFMTGKAWETGGAEQRVALKLTVQPPASFGMAQVNLNPAIAETGRTISFTGSGFTNVTPSQVTELRFANLNILAGQSLPTINIPATGASAGTFSGSFRVPSVLSPGTYPVTFRAGTPPFDKFVSKPFTITGGGDTFVLQASPQNLWVEQGSSAVTNIQVQAIGSASPTVNLSLEGYPASDITPGFASASVTPTPGGVAGTDLTLTLQDWAPAGHYTVTVKGQRASTGETHYLPLQVDVVPPAGFGMASVYVTPTMGSAGTWVTISGSGFPADTTIDHLYLGPPVGANDVVPLLPEITTNSAGSFTAVIQVPAGLTPGMYPIEVVAGAPPDDKRASAAFTLFGEQAAFNLNVSPRMLQAAPGSPATTSVNVQSVGSSSANVTLRVDGPPNIQWRFNGGGWQSPVVVAPPIGGTVFSSLEVVPSASTPMGFYSLAVRAYDDQEEQVLNLDIGVGAAAGYSMPIFSLNPANGVAGTSVTFNGSNFPPGTPFSSLTFGSRTINLSQPITTSPQGSFSGAFVVPGNIDGQPVTAGTYPVRVMIGPAKAEAPFNVFGSGDTFAIRLSPSFLQGGPGGEPGTAGMLQSLSGAAPTVKMAVRGLPPGVTTRWNGNAQQVFTLSAPPGGQNNFSLALALPNMIPMGQYPATLEGWVDSTANNTWDPGEQVVRVNLELAVMPPQGYGMGMLSLMPSYGRVGDRISFVGAGFPADTAVASLTFAGTDVLEQAVTTSSDGSFSGVFTVPETAFGQSTGPGIYPVDVIVGTLNGNFGFQVTGSGQKFNVDVSPGWLARTAGDTGSVNIVVRSLVNTPPSPTVLVRVEGLPVGVTPSFTETSVTPPVGNMESRELRLTISGGAPPGQYPVAVRAYNAADASQEIVVSFTLEITPSAGFMDMGMATVTTSPNAGSAGDQITVSGYGFPRNANLTFIRIGPVDVTPAGVVVATDASGAFSAVVRVPVLPGGPYPVEVNVQNTVRRAPFNITGGSDTFTLNVSPMWLEPVPAGDASGRQVTITVKGLPGKTPTVTLSTEGLFTPFGTITQVWEPASKVVTVTSAGGSVNARLTLKASENLPPGPYPFMIVGVDSLSSRKIVPMEFRVSPPANFMGGFMGVDPNAWNQQWQGTEFASGIFFPEVTLSPNSGPAGTQVSYTGSNLPPDASVTAIYFAGQAVPLPADGITADDNGGFSGSFVVSDEWGLAAGGVYDVEFRMENDGWSQNLFKPFNLMRSGAAYSLEAAPNWIPPIPPGSFGQTKINARALGFSSANITLGILETLDGGMIPGGAQARWGASDGPAVTSILVPAAGQASENLYVQGFVPGRYMMTVVGWTDSNDNQLLDRDIPSEDESAFPVTVDFEVQPPQQFMTWDRGAIMDQMGLAETDRYLLYFPEITLSPNVGQAGAKVTVSATAFPPDAGVTHLRFGGVELPVPAGTASDDNGAFMLVFNVPKTMWGGNTASGWYDVAVEAQKAGESPVFVMKSFQVTASDVAFTLKADPDWLPPIAINGNGTTLVRVTSGTGATVNLSVDKIPPGVTTSFSSSQVTVPPGGSGSSTLTLTPTNIPPGRYGAEIKGTATVGGEVKIFYTHLEFEVQPPQQFMTWDRGAIMDQMGLAETDRYLLYF
ncbi:MAG: hypothetical protein HYX96_01115, partial [Chloroflexi bacterium]|nr:hypothetical protein [Chloroflexota bacterium]